MRQRRDTTGASNEIDGVLERRFVVADKSGPVFPEITAEGLRYICHLTGFDEHFRYMGPTDGSMARLGEDGIGIDVESQLSELLAHQADPVLTPPSRLDEKPSELGVVLVDEEAQDVHRRVSKMRTHFDARHDFEAGSIGLALGLSHAFNGVVVRNRQRLQPLSFR